MAYYKEIDWHKLHHHEITPPYIPPLRGDDDTANFEENDTRSAANFLTEPPYDYTDAWDADF